MADKHTLSKRAERLNRAGLALWLLTFALMLSLTATVPALYVPLLQFAGKEGSTPWIKDVYAAIVSLCGLVLVFCLYTFSKQRELNRMREALGREEREKENVRTRLSELSALFQVSTTLQLHLRLEVILEIIVRRVVSTMRAQQASIMIYNPEIGELETRASYGLEAEFSKGARAKLGEGIAGWVALRREAVVLGEKAPNAELGKHYKENRKITSALSLPLHIGERVVGVLNVNRIHHPEVFQDHHIEMLRLFGDHVAAVIERAEVMERLGHRTRELEADNLKLVDLNRMKDVFLSTASHELKTPLTAVIAYAELLDDHDSKLSKEQSNEFVHRLRAEAQRLLSLIEDILDLSRLESGKLVLKPRPISVNEVAHAAVETTRALAKKYDVTLREVPGTDLPSLPLDEVKMRQVLVNLLVNAVKFSPRNGEVVLTSHREGNFIRVEVTDNGPGIAPEAATHIFELFQQGVPVVDDHRGGLGIGLHLVRRIVELHGGHVGVNSPPGKGSTFWVRLPIVDAVTIPAPPASIGGDQEQREAA